MLACSPMAGNSSPPDYELNDRMALTDPSQVKALSHPLRNTILALLHERAATVTELAVALDRPKSTVAHHVKVLNAAGLVRVVRTRKVRAIEERFFGRTARMFYVALEQAPEGDQMPRDFNDFEVAARESVEAYHDGKLWGFIRHARITEDQASEVLGADGQARRGVRPASALGLDNVRIRGRRLPHRSSDPAGRRRLGGRANEARVPPRRPRAAAPAAGRQRGTNGRAGS